MQLNSLRLRQGRDPCIDLFQLPLHSLAGIGDQLYVLRMNRDVVLPFSRQIKVERTRQAATTRTIPKKEGILCALVTCEAQNRATVPGKCGEDGHILRLTR